MHALDPARLRVNFEVAVGPARRHLQPYRNSITPLTPSCCMLYLSSDAAPGSGYCLSTLHRSFIMDCSMGVQRASSRMAL